MEQQAGPRPEAGKNEGRFFDNVRRGAEVFAAVGAGPIAAWFANYLVDVPAALAIGAAVSTAVGVTMAGLEVAVLSAYKRNSERRMGELFSQEPDKYVPRPPDADEVIKRAGQKK